MFLQPIHTHKASALLSNPIFCLKPLQDLNPAIPPGNLPWGYKQIGNLKQQKRKRKRDSSFDNRNLLRAIA
jgi:hypothetical protein